MIIAQGPGINLTAPALLAGALLLAALPAASLPASAASLAETFEGHDPMSRMTIDHAIWAELLDTYVTASGDGINRVDYGALAGSEAGLGKLGRYIDRMQDVEVSALARDEQFAYWANLYNAVTVEVIVEHYPVASIRDISISPGLFWRGPWGKKLVTVEGEELSLDDIEHEILRKVWDEPRVHFAVNCASIGCPNLRREPFTGTKLDDQLAEAARDYVNHPRGAAFDGDTLLLSSIFDWYGKDFGSPKSERLETIAQWAEPALADKIAGHTGSIRYAYDWSLNDTRDER